MTNTFEISFCPLTSYPPWVSVLYSLFFMISLCRAAALNSTLVGTSMFLHLTRPEVSGRIQHPQLPFPGRFTESWVGCSACPHCCVVLHPSIHPSWHFHFPPVANRTAASFLAHVLLNISEAKRRIPGSPVAKGFLRHPRGLASPEASTSSRGMPMDPDSCKPPASSDLGGVHLMGMR